MEFKLTSPAFAHGKQIPSKYTCDGENINPHLVIHGVPQGTKSLAMIMEDPDSQAGLWIHWVAWNIPPDTSEIKEHRVAFGAMEGPNSWNETGYGGPCPSSGTHRYFFRLYALDTRLTLPSDTVKEDLEKAMTGHILATTELMGTYIRTNQAPL